ncbi:MAG: TIM barrel protein [Nanoarchaeota archaeon]|nr:TIM barrel protein [Nanoarchaeota archaeon]MBU0963210.1 TIM barrel protein [Nanoarchaeota archaeon]
MIKIGPAGIGGAKECSKNLEYYNKQGITCAEIPFTYGIWMSNKQAEDIGKIAKENKVQLSIHAPYYINLNSAELKKIEESKKRILDCCEKAHYLNAKCVVFHPGFYGKLGKEETYNIIKENINEIVDYINEKKWNVKIAPETTGKVNVFGSLDEIFNLVKETKCYFCIDFAHQLARSNGKMTYEEMCEKIKDFKDIHAHFSGIDYGIKGEKNHKLTDEKEIEKLGQAIKKYKIENITIINESPNPIGDSEKTIKIFRELKLL